MIETSVTMDLRQTILEALHLCILPTSNLYQLLTQKIKIFIIKEIKKLNVLYHILII
jgi:hypothetical protein